MSDATLSDPRVRAAQNHWYLYFSRDPAYGPDGHVRAVIEESCDEIWSGDDGPTRARRRVYLDVVSLRDFPRPTIQSELAAHDGLDWAIENEMSDEQFQELVDNGTIIPISVPQ
jgi:hypothetical protein